MPSPPNYPPIITLVGDATLEVELLSFFSDPGATAAKPLAPGPVPVTASAAPPVDTAAAGNYTITYTSTDSTGLSADPVTRVVVVFDPCMRRAPPLRFCPDLSSPGDIVCPQCAGGACLCLAPLAAAAAAAVAPFAVTAYTAPPALTLLGSGALEMLPDGTQRMTHTITVFDAWDADPGVTAEDPIDGDLTANVTRSFGALGPVNASAATPPGEFYSVVYTATNGGRLEGRAERRVAVTDPCAATGSGERLCGRGGQCSQDGICAGITAGPAVGGGGAAGRQGNTPPQLELVGPSSVVIAVNTAYDACPPGADLSAPCERGATATDAEDGNLAPKVLACGPPPGQQPSPAHSFARSGLFACFYALRGAAGVAGAPLPVSETGLWLVPGRFNLTLSVTDSAGATAAATRLLTVTPQCAAGERLCADRLSCSAGRVCVGDLGDVAGPTVETAGAPTITLQTTVDLTAAVTVPRCVALPLWHRFYCVLRRWRLQTARRIFFVPVPPRRD